MHKCRIYGPDKLSYNHFIIWSSRVTLAFNLTEQMFQKALLLLKENNCATLFWNPCINVEVVARTSWIYYHFIIWPSCDLDLQPTWINVSNGTAAPQEEQLRQIILKSMHKCRSYSPDKLSLLPFYHLTFKCDLDLQPTWTNVSNGTATPQAEQLCQIILKSMQKCRSYGCDKLNICDIQVWYWPSTYIKSLCSDSDGTSLPQGDNYAKLFWNPCINVEVMAKLFWNPCINVGVMAVTSSIYVTYKCDIDLQPT